MFSSKQHAEYTSVQLGLLESDLMAAYSKALSIRVKLTIYSTSWIALPVMVIMMLLTMSDVGCCSIPQQLWAGWSYQPMSEDIET